MDDLLPVLVTANRKLLSFDEKVRSLLAKVSELDETPDGDYALLTEALQDYLSATAAPLEEFMARYVKLLKLYLYD